MLKLNFLLFALLGFTALPAAADLFFSDTKIIRDGQIVVMVDDSWCRAINFDNLHRVVPEGESTVMEVISRVLSSKRVITAEELTVCNGGSDQPPPPILSFDEGFSYGSAPGHVVYADNNQYAGAGSRYPTTANGVTFGWDGTNFRFSDRSNQLPAELAGVAYVPNDGVQATFRVDLPAPGIYNLSIAIGDAESGRVNAYVKIMDGFTVVAEYNGVTTSAGAFVDATGVERGSPSEWVSGNAPITHEFVGPVLTVIVGQPTQSAGVSVISHLRITAE